MSSAMLHQEAVTAPTRVLRGVCCHLCVFAHFDHEGDSTLQEVGPTQQLAEGHQQLLLQAAAHCAAADGAKHCYSVLWSRHQPHSGSKVSRCDPWVHTLSGSQGQLLQMQLTLWVLLLWEVQSSVSQGISCIHQVLTVECITAAC
jgi:hypothetical protein